MASKTRCVSCGVAGGVLLAIGIALLVASLVIQFSTLPANIKDTLNTEKVLKRNPDGSMNSFTRSWVSPKYVSYAQFWVYDYQNVGGILNRAALPDADEKGPYTYKIVMANEVAGFNNDSTQVDYVHRQTYLFDKEMSCKGCDPFKDTVNTPDIVFQFFTAMIPPLSGLKDTLCPLLEQLGQNCEQIFAQLDALYPSLGVIPTLFNAGPFAKVTVDQLLFSGYASPLAKSIEDMHGILDGFIETLHLEDGDDHLYDLKFYIDMFLPQITEALNIKVNYMRTNATADVVYTAETGKSEPERAGYILSFSNATEDGPASDGNLLPEDWWPYNATESDWEGCDEENARKARLIAGTTGEFFMSQITKKDQIPLYVSDICRSVKLSYVEDVTVKGVDGMRFAIPESVFDASVAENCGFCKKTSRDIYDIPMGSNCLPTGLIDLSGCQKMGELTLPIVASQPHFYQADKRAAAFYPRTKPSASDATTIDIEPTTGTLLQANKRIQVNLWIGQKPSDFIKAYSVMRSGAYPLFYVNESSVIDETSKKELQDSLAPATTISLICWIALGVGAALIVASLVFFYCAFCVSSKKYD